jgi:hypothetical protein
MRRKIEKEAHVHQEEDEKGRSKSKHEYIKKKMRKEDRKVSMSISGER